MVLYILEKEVVGKTNPKKTKIQKGKLTTDTTESDEVVHGYNSHQWNNKNQIESNRIK